MDLENGNGAGAIRPIGLTPPGVFTNDVLAAVIDYIFEGTEKVFEINPVQGEKVILFSMYSRTLETILQCPTLWTYYGTVPVFHVTYAAMEGTTSLDFKEASTVTQPASIPTIHFSREMRTGPLHSVNPIYPVKS